MIKAVIAARAESLSRFMQAYAQLAKLPPPKKENVDLAASPSDEEKKSTRPAKKRAIPRLRDAKPKKKNAK